jgi:hypothetical protein
VADQPGNGEHGGQAVRWWRPFVRVPSSTNYRVLMLDGIVLAAERGAFSTT